MTTQRRWVLALVLAAGWALLAPASAQAGAGAKAQARQILAATDVKGGLVIHVGCGDGALTAALRANDSYLVQGLTTDLASVAKARGERAQARALRPRDHRTLRWQEPALRRGARQPHRGRGPGRRADGGGAARPVPQRGGLRPAKRQVDEAGEAAAAGPASSITGASPRPSTSAPWPWPARRSSSPGRPTWWTRRRHSTPMASRPPKRSSRPSTPPSRARRAPSSWPSPSPTARP